MICLMTCTCVFSLALYLIPYEFVFWRCDAALGSLDNSDKWLDVAYYACMAVYLSVLLFYCLQRAALEADKERGTFCVYYITTIS